MSKVRFVIGILLSVVLTAHAEWNTHFAYNNVEQIAMAGDYVYGLSGDALYRVNRMTERMEAVDTKFGLHSTGICAIGYDPVSKRLLVTYRTGKADLISGNKVTYVPDLYETDMVASKQVNAITYTNGRAYLSMNFGILTFDMFDLSFVDSYYIGPEGTAVNVEDVVVRADSIFAFSDDLMYKASLDDNVSDFRNWSVEVASGRVARDADKGKRIQDEYGEVWTSAGEQGICRVPVSGAPIYYKPDGPAVNTPYRMYVGPSGKLYVVPGGRWALQLHRSGDVMIYENGRWTNITAEEIKQQSGSPIVEDFMNVAEDPMDASHFYVTSYGSGLYEFRGNRCVQRYTPSNSSLRSAVETEPDLYTRCDNAMFDTNGNLLVLGEESEHPLCVRSQDGEWGYGEIYRANQFYPIYTPTALMADRRNGNHKIITYGRYEPGVLYLNDGGTLLDSSDDVSVKTGEWVDQDGQTVEPEKVLTAIQDAANNIWIGTDNGVVIIPAEEDYFASNNCRRLRIPEGDVYLTEGEEVNAIAQDGEGHIWIGTGTQGVYVLSEDGNSLLARYNSGNSPMPSNMVLSLMYSERDKVMYVGTGDGLVSYSTLANGVTNSTPEWAVDAEGSMFRFTLYPSFYTSTQVAVARDAVYGVASGGLFAIDRETEQITMYDKTSGLSSSTVIHIGYDPKSQYTIVVYADGNIDLIRRGEVMPMNDLYQKAEDLSMDVNSLYMDGNGRCYLSMTFGIVVLNLMKQEVEDTYYIGEEGANVNVLSVTTDGDVVYAASATQLFVGSRKDNLLDYNNWSRSLLPSVTGEVKLAYTDALYMHTNDSNLYRLQGSWSVVSENCRDIFWAGTDLLVYDTLDVLSYWQGERLGQYGGIKDVQAASDGTLWMAASSAGIAHRLKGGHLDFYTAEGPYNNLVDNLQFAGQKLFVSAGAYWTIYRSNDITLKTYDDGKWSYIPWRDNTNPEWTQALQKCHYMFHDLVNVAVDPSDNSHFYAACYGSGVIEYRDNRPYKLYSDNSVTPGTTLRAATASDKFYYTLCSGATLDAEGNLWVQNAQSGLYPVNVMDTKGVWHGLSLGGNQLSTPGKNILIDSRDNRYKWIIDGRNGAAIYLLDDGGTPTDPSDDKVYKKGTLTDQYGTMVPFTNLYCITQDLDGVIWVGSNVGPFQIASVSAFERGGCERVLNRRNDGTILADYLLSTEIIKSIAVDGGNRKWFGTENHGLFLISEDGSEEMEHFTTKNSNLPADEVTSLAINPVTGEVFIGTTAGICSYKSDATEAQDDYSSAYAYPNPVRPNYDGVVTINGLVEDSWVHITDAGGNVVYKTRSYGGSATWDLSNGRGGRVSTGVYTAICCPSSSEHRGRGFVKVLVMGR